MRVQANGICQYCGKKGTQAHHILSRRHYGSRWLVSNGLFLCSGCHLFIAHRDYEKFRQRVIELLGEEEFERIKAIAYSVVKFTADDLEEVRRGLS